MPKDQHFFEDMSKLAGSVMQTAFSSAHDFKHQFDNAIKARLNEILAHTDMVSREEFEVVKEMAARARAENEILKERIELLEAENHKKSSKK